MMSPSPTAAGRIDRDAVLKRLISWLRRASGNVALGLIDQVILAGSAFALTLLLAKVLDVRAFGSFSVAWSCSILVESVLLRGLFDDGLPAVAHRIPRTLWPQLKLGLYASALTVSAVLGGAVIIAGCIMAASGYNAGVLIIVTGMAIPAIRLQSMFRRVSYLDGKLIRAVVSAVIYCAVLGTSGGLMIVFRLTGATAAMSCIAVSAAVAGSLAFVFAGELAPPTARIFRTSLVRLLRSGRWFVATSLTYWISSIGLIPLCGALIGLEASASLRILLLVFAPLSQLFSTVFAVRLPSIAAELRAGRTTEVAAAARENAMLLGSMSVVYGAGVILLGQRLLALVIDHQSYAIDMTSLVLMTVAMSLDAVWLGLALPLFATGKPQKFMLSRAAGLIALCCALPFAAYLWQVTGAVAAMVASSAASVIVVLLTNSVRERP